MKSENTGCLVVPSTRLFFSPITSFCYKILLSFARYILLAEETICDRECDRTRCDLEARQCACLLFEKMTPDGTCVTGRNLFLDQF